MKTAPEKHNDSFVPKGAIAFFISLSAFFAVVWLGFYALLIMRQHG